MNPKTHAILRALGFVADETYAVLGVTDYVRNDDLIAVYHTTRPDQIADVIAVHAVARHKRRMKDLRAEMKRLEE